jgi:iron complex transport system ATP-binding protein
LETAENAAGSVNCARFTSSANPVASASPVGSTSSTDAASSAHLLDARGISISLGGKPIIKDIALCVEHGEFVGMIGPNGSGKTTFLKRVYRVLAPQGGTILLDGRELERMRARDVAEHMAVVGQFNEMNFDFTVREIVSMGRTPHKGLLERLSQQDNRYIDEALSLVGLSACGQRSYQTLSGGEKQRVVLARAIAQKPRIIILDEPTNHLDLKYQIQILSVVRGLGIGVLAAMHDLTLAAQYCDRLYVLKGGDLVAQGRPRELLTAELIRAVYEIDCTVYENPVTGGFAFAVLD